MLERTRTSAVAVVPPTRRWLGLLGAGSLAVVAGVSLAQRSAVETSSRLIAVPSLGLFASRSGAALSAVSPGRSGTLAVVARPSPDAAPPPAVRPEARSSRAAARAAARAVRKATIARLTRVLSGFATGLDPEAERALATTVHDVSRRWGLDPFLVLAVIETESTYRNGAVSFMGARGLMQIRPFVGEELAARLRLEWDGDETLHDPILNVTMGVYYLAQLRARFGDLSLALAGYNIGPNAVQALLDDEREVPSGYVRKVLASYARLLGRDARPSFSGGSPGRPARVERAPRRAIGAAALATRAAAIDVAR